MGKAYRYYAAIQVGEQESVTISIELPDKETSFSATAINTQSGIIDIKNEGNAGIGKGSDIKAIPVIIASNPLNPAPEIDKIRLNIYANDKMIVRHISKKSESETPQIMVFLTIQLSRREKFYKRNSYP